MENNQNYLIEAKFMKRRDVITFIIILAAITSFILFKYYAKVPLSLQHASLFDAVWAGNMQEVNYYIAQGNSLKKNEEHRIPPLNAAVYLEHFEIAKALLEKGANVHEMEDESGWTALHEAAAKNRIDFAQLLVEFGVDVNATAHANTERGFNDFGDTPLIVAACNGHLEMVKFLVDHGANINKSDNNGITPLHGAVNNDCLEVVKYLLSQKAEVNSWDCRGQERPLNSAQDNNNKEIIALLTSAGAIAEERISWLDIPLEETTT